MKPSLSTYIGLPYETTDCFQLAQKFYIEQFEVQLKHYYSEMPEDRQEIENLIYSNVGDFDRVDSPEFGDLIILKILGIESHVGVYIGKDNFIHSVKVTGSCMDRLDRWKGRVTGFYRLKGIRND